CIFREREEMLRYVRRVHGDLGPEGMFCLDIHGGPDAQVETEEVKRLQGFDYVWEQAPIDAVSARGMRYIHFRFRDGTELKRAFSYDWRLWTLPELRDLLQEAGYSRVDVYWEGDDGKGGGNGIFRKVVRAENEASWIAYVVAWR
ncbi:MAG: class I SAM-dependent methyltransferase, partial [Myxococcota bacterium]